LFTRRSAALLLDGVKVLKGVVAILLAPLENLTHLALMAVFLRPCKAPLDLGQDLTHASPRKERQKEKPTSIKFIA
jgi:hypothetical protein